MSEDKFQTFKVTKGNIVVGSDGEKVAWSEDEGADNKVSLSAAHAKALKEAGVIE